MTVAPLLADGIPTPTRSIRPTKVGALTDGLPDAVEDGSNQTVEQLDDTLDGLRSHLFPRRTNADIRRRTYQLGATLRSTRAAATGMVSRAASGPRR